jgi:hypothetical protein
VVVVVDLNVDHLGDRNVAYSFLKTTGPKAAGNGWNEWMEGAASKPLCVADLAMANKNQMDPK